MGGEANALFATLKYALAANQVDDTNRLLKHY
jgi:hypothetical protein